jgi:hypothetical protein
VNRDDIIRMAREAGLHLATDVNWMPIIDFEYAEKFAALVAAAEREACAELAERHAIDREDEYVCYKIADAIRARGETK